MTLPKPINTQVERYLGGLSKFDKIKNPIKLSANESALGASPKAIKAFENDKDMVFKYPESDSNSLRDVISKKFNIDFNRIICGAGSDQIFDLTCKLFLKPNDEVIVSEFGFIMHRIYSSLCGAKVLFAKEKNFTTSVEEILKMTTTKTKIVSRGNKISIKGNKTQLLEVEKIILSLIIHFNKFGKIDNKTISNHIRNGSSNEEKDVIVFGSNGKKILAKTSNQKKIVTLIKTNDLVFVIGPAGTGKTYVSVALALKALKDKSIKKIIITRPVVEAGENLGFLPGDLQEKIEPYLRPIYDALQDMLPINKIKKYIENKTIEIAPIAYMRGRTLKNAFVLLDEAQNTTPSQLKMFLTRLGPNSKMIVTGDISQIDLIKNQKSGLKDAIKRFKNINGIEFTSLDNTDVLRHSLVKKILEKY